MSKLTEAEKTFIRVHVARALGRPVEPKAPKAPVRSPAERIYSEPPKRPEDYKVW